ncbi:hypothetical protein BXP70_22155 [Hymenobacter crusticola]|uniref:Uncharacterized protein n=2 Tax=Hymenobacter crusticola TaxID=1770526 RepID=A0A243W7Y9_9BACT|nr:hypothetical protein BXP70_22155 [Hymenobacter crusticola]
MQIARDQRFLPQYVLQFNTMPADDSLYSRLEEDSGSRWYYTQREMEALRLWRDYRFTNDAFHNWWIIQASQPALDRLQRFPNSVDGIRLRFHSNAFYSDVIKVLDLLAKHEKNRCLVDAKGQALTIYAFTEEPAPKTVANCVDSYGFLGECRLILRVASELPGVLPLQQLLLDPAWRNSLYLLLLLSIVSIWKMTRPSFY